MVLQSKEFIDEQLSKLTPIKYNRFHWWRNYTSKPPLHKYSGVERKYHNGDFDLSHYYWQAQNAIHEMNDKIAKERDSDKHHEIRSLYMEKYRRLIVDFEKDEQDRLREFKACMWAETGITRQELESIMQDFDGTLLDLLNHCIELRQQKIKNSLNNEKTVHNTEGDI